jgi:FkbM family methyltransferase
MAATLAPVKRALRGGELRSVVALTASEAVARILAFAYYLVAARSLAPSGFGVVRYTITLSLLGFALMQVLVTIIGREVGAARGDREATAGIVGGSLAIGAVLWLGSVALTVAAAALGLTGAADAAGLVVVLSGLAVLQVYYAIARGLGDMRRMAFTLVGGAVIQLATFGALASTSHLAPRTALLVYGISSVLPVLACEIVRPVISPRAFGLNRVRVHRMWKLAAPLLVAQACYLIWNSADQVWVEETLGTAQVGLYAAARNFSQVFAVLPAGVAGVLLPRVAELRAMGEDDRARRLIAVGTAATLGLSALLAVAVIAERTPLLETLYGGSFGGAATPMVGVAVAMAAYAGFATLTQAVIGWGRPAVYTIGIAVAAGAEVVLLAALPDGSSASAAWAFAGSIALALVIVVAWVAGLGRLAARARHVPGLLRQLRFVREPLRFTRYEIRRGRRLARYTLRRSGLSFFLRHHTADSTAFNEVFVRRLYEPPREAAEVLGGRERSVRVLDVGAHIGLFGLYALDRFDGAEVVAIEPDPANAALLRRAIGANAGERWRVIEACASTAPGSASFRRLDAGTDSHVVFGRDDPDAVDVPAIDVFDHLRGVDLLKLDAEGAEWGILEDERFGPSDVPVVVMEYHPLGCPEPDARAAAYRLLVDAGYEVRFVADQGDGMGMIWGTRRDAVVAGAQSDRSE